MLYAEHGINQNGPEQNGLYLGGGILNAFSQIIIDVFRLTFTDSSLIPQFAIFIKFIVFGSILAYQEFIMKFLSKFDNLTIDRNNCHPTYKTEYILKRTVMKSHEAYLNGDHFVQVTMSTPSGCHKTDVVLQTTSANALAECQTMGSIKISLNVVPKGPDNNMTTWFQIMGCRQTCDKPLSEPMMA